MVKIAHSVHADPSSSHPTRLARPSSSLSILSVPSPSLTPFPQADPISFRSQATARSHVGHTTSMETPTDSTPNLSKAYSADMKGFSKNHQ